MHILALEPYYGGSHRAFLDGWRRHSRHRWTLLTLPPRHWKWRMRHAAITFATSAHELVDQGERFDAVFATDMVNLAEFRGLFSSHVEALPSVFYFHENQLTYPSPHGQARDHHFGFSNLISAQAATSVWFNSAFHRDDFLTAAEQLLASMPDHAPLDMIETIAAKSRVEPPGVDAPLPTTAPPELPLRIAWASRWEHDKAPEVFFEALRLLMDRDIDFRVIVLGEQFRSKPAVFESARRWLADRILYFGYQPTRAAYERALSEAHVFVSTAHHEFFGIAAVEALSAGVVPLLPNRLSYPEILGVRDPKPWLYDGSSLELSQRLVEMAELLASGRPLAGPDSNPERFLFTRRAPAMDNAILEVC